MSTTRLADLIREHRGLMSDVRASVRARSEMAAAFHADVRRSCARPFRGADLRIVSMASLVLEAHELALQEENGMTIDVLSDALRHLQDRVEREVLPSVIGCG